MAIASLHLDPQMLASTRAGQFNFLNRVCRALADAGITADPRPLKAAPEALSLWHMEAPAGLKGALIFRRTYHYPFWHIEAVPQRWRWPVARATFDAEAVDTQQARVFVARLAARVLPGPPPTRDGPALIALQGRLREMRSFQTMSPIEMVKAVGRSGIQAVAALHPRENYSAADLAALDQVVARYPTLSVVSGAAGHLRDCAYVITQNSAVAFDGMILGKAAVLFAQIDFHHIALNVAQLGTDEALRRGPRNRPPTPRYIHWFLCNHAIDAMAPDAEAQIAAALKRGGWPVS